MDILDSDDRMWTLVSVGAASLTAIAIRRAAGAGWRRWKRRDPPKNPADPAVDWGEALLWAGGTAAAVALGRVVARRAAASGWERVTGRPPPT